MSDTQCWVIFNICHVYIHASQSCVDSQTYMNANEAEKKELEQDTERGTQKSAYVIAKCPD